MTTESLTTTEIRITVTGRPALYWARETDFGWVHLAGNPVDDAEELDLADDEAKIEEVLGEDQGLISQDIYLSDLLGLWVEGGEGADHSVGQIVAAGEHPNTVLVSWHGEEQSSEDNLDGLTVCDAPGHLVADELTVYEPIARADRAGSTAPILPIRICVWAGEVVAEYADWSPEKYASLDALLSAHEMTREELGEQTN